MFKKIKINKMTRIIVTCAVLVGVVLSVSQTALVNMNVRVNAQSFIKPSIDINSEAVYLTNQDTGEVIFEKNSNAQVSPAQLTNIMTVLVAIEQLGDIENTMVTVPRYIYDDFVGLTVPHVDIKRDEKVPMEDLLYASILRSAAEASSAIADHVGKGSIPKFVDLMNEKAQDIGATNTTFRNANGIYNEKQLTTARDMYLITEYAMENPLFNKIATTKTYTMKATDIHKEERVIMHNNGMMNVNTSGPLYYQYISGIKTGSIKESGRHLISTASKSGQNYMLITLGAPIEDEKGTAYEQNLSYVDQKNIYEWVFSSFEYRTYADTKNAIGEVAVELGATQDYLTMVTKNKISILLPKELDVDSVVSEVAVPDVIYAPIKKGDKIGMLYLKVDGQKVGEVELLAGATIERSAFLYATYLLKKFYSNGWVILLTIVLILLIILYAMFLSAAIKRAKKIKRIKREKQRKSNVGQ